MDEGIHGAVRFVHRCFRMFSFRSFNSEILLWNFLKSILPVLDELPMLLQVTKPGFSVVTTGRPVVCTEGSLINGFSELEMGKAAVALTPFVLDDAGP